MDIAIAILAAVAGGLVGFAMRPFVPALDAWAYRIQRRFGPTPSAEELFDIDFVNDRGENIYSKQDDPNLKADDTTWYIVKVHFKCHAKQRVVVTNLELDYSIIGSLPGEQTITIDGEEVPTDGRYGLGRNMRLTPGLVRDVKIVRRFHCRADRIWDRDYSYERVVIAVDFLMPHSGFSRLVIEGKLAESGFVSDAVATLRTPAADDTA